MKRPMGLVGFILMPMLPSVLNGRVLPWSSMIWSKRPVNPTLQSHPNTPALPTQYLTVLVTPGRINGGRSPVRK